ncbi:hypothetical protein DP113_33080 (plasmid) [Brasilonema octagenarum UFV-E1]|uniref:HTH cro/C1-type domain-containing protein n=3 Tax=Scytonemataceae TaxID=1182 RepID=A0A856MSB2_9CYAN|nr:hypothetical protein [Brasilonema octagenarum UFV-OR1]QDL12581.1 hypothetical protein DP114_32980 [Brasilonema sennae CENA114]QDL18975.1 hypothetical protein DP113_33080 [Brasilonema octagenarum UFV-E1]
MIRWRLRMLMAEKKITNKELAELSGIHPTSISKLKNADEIEQISGRVLNNLCNGLTKAYHARGENRIITPGDLLDYTFDGNGDCPTSVDDIEQSMEKTSTDHSSGDSGKTTKAIYRVVYLSKIGESA